MPKSRAGLILYTYATSSGAITSKNCNCVQNSETVAYSDSSTQTNNKHMNNFSSSPTRKLQRLTTVSPIPELTLRFNVNVLLYICRNSTVTIWGTLSPNYQTHDICTIKHCQKSTPISGAVFQCQFFGPYASEMKISGAENKHGWKYYTWSRRWICRCCCRYNSGIGLDWAGFNVSTNTV